MVFNKRALNRHAPFVKKANAIEKRLSSQADTLMMNRSFFSNVTTKPGDNNIVSALTSLKTPFFLSKKKSWSFTFSNRIFNAGSASNAYIINDSMNFEFQWWFNDATNANSMMDRTHFYYTEKKFNFFCFRLLFSEFWIAWKKTRWNWDENGVTLLIAEKNQMTKVYMSILVCVCVLVGFSINAWTHTADKRTCLVWQCHIFDTKTTSHWFIRTHSRWKWTMEKKQWKNDAVWKTVWWQSWFKL